ncbi:MAG: hypothetical protein K2H69_00800, partial [Alistipes sp.]|nr:hypothetical protein [Alistipes sp.]
MKQLTLEEKQTVQAQLQAYVARYPSQTKAVNSLGLGAGTVCTILNGRFDNISDEMFLRIRSLVAPAAAVTTRTAPSATTTRSRSVCATTS